MATAEATSDPLGPQYAPKDPTLPKPWEGLVDGSTGLLYYWNPETNVTQYEKPAAPAPPLPSEPPPPASTPKLAPIPMARNLQPNVTMHPQPQQHPGQQMPQQHPGQQMPQQHPGQQMPQQHPGQQMQQHPGQQMQLQHAQQMAFAQTQQMPSQQGHQYPPMHMQQMPYPQMSYQQGLRMPYQPQQQLQGPQIPYQPPEQQQAPNLVHQESQVAHSVQQPGLHAVHPQGQQPRATQSPQQQSQYLHGPQGANQQGQQIGFPRGEELGRQDGKQTGFSLPLVQQSGAISSSHHLQGAAPQAKISQTGVHSIQPEDQLSVPSSVSSQQTGPSSIQLQQAGIDASYRQRQMGSPVVNSHTGHTMFRPPMGPKMGYEGHPRERIGDEFHSSSRNEGPMMIPQQPKFGALPPRRDQQDMRMSSINPELKAPGLSGGLNMVPGNRLPNMHNHSTISNGTPMRLSPRVFDPSDYSHTSATDAYCQHHEVSALGDNVPAPFMTFEATGFPPEILKEIHLAGFSSPTPIQAQTWPIALQSRDVVAIAKTGSGKTLGYLIPAFLHLRNCRNNPQFGPTVLVLAPTRELATQIQDEAIKFGRSSRLSCTCLYGGAPKGPQIKEVERGVDIIVATPGRLNDILEMKKINFRQISFLVLDEADRMLDMGFEPQIRKIVNEIPPRRQTLMYTATWPKEVRKIAGDLLVNPVQVNIGNVDELVANKSITQFVEVVQPMDRERRLQQILRTQERGSKIIIFCSTKRLCDQLARSIGRTFGAAAIHGDKSQGERDHVLNQFRSGRTPILVATDVAARGLDIKDIRVVVNYDFPNGVEDYIHRIGRTGRAGATGLAYTFFSDQDWKHASDLVKLLEGANQRVPPEVRDMVGRGGSAFSRGRGGMSRWDSGGGGRSDFGGGRGGGFNGRGGGRSDFSGGRGGGRGDFSGGRGGRGPPGRFDRGSHERYGGGRGRYDVGQRDRNRDRSYSPSPERGRGWGGYQRGRSDSRSRSRSWSRSRSRSRSRSWSYERPERRPARNNFSSHPPGAEPLGQDNGSFPRTELAGLPPGPGFSDPGPAAEL